MKTGNPILCAEGLSAKPRPYQVEAVEGTVKAYLNTSQGGNKRCLISLPTGTGKTFTAIAALYNILERTDRTPMILWVAHRSELIEQAMDEARRWGFTPHLWCGDKKEVGNFTVASVQSWRGLAAQMEQLRDGRDVITVVDEAHHIAASSYLHLIEDVPSRLVLMLTATPTRLDKEDLGIDQIIIQRSFLEMVEDGYLAVPQYIRYKTDVAATLRMQGGDFSNASMQELNCEYRNNLLVREVLSDQEVKWRRSIIFAIDVRHAHDLYQVFREHGFENVRYVHGGHRKEFRKRVVNWFKECDQGILINCQLFEEGFDAPRTTGIVLGRPTASNAKWMQWIGRGSRITGEKDRFYILDLVDQVDKYALLAEKWSTETLQAEPDPSLEAQRKEDDYLSTVEETVRSELEASGVRVPKRIKKEIPEIVGILECATKWTSAKVAITRSQYEVMERLYLEFLAGKSPTFGASYYDHVNSDRFYAEMNPDGEFGKRVWKKVCWAMFYRYVMHYPTLQGRPTFEFTSIEDLLNQRRPHETNEPANG